MRPVKFRTWDKKNNIMATVMTISWRCGEIECVHHYKDHKGGVYLFNGEDGKDFELMQYTGIKDRNGKEIYEGDIVYIDLDRPKGLAEIGFHEGAFFCFMCFGKLSNSKIFSPAIPLRHVIDSSIEIKGNIYENPELLNDH